MDAFDAQRPRLFALAYRMLGTRADADDLVHECWLRWNAADRSAIDAPAAWLTTVMARLCLDQRKSARARREAYVGPWLPEPLPTEDDAPVDERAAMAESVSVALVGIAHKGGVDETELRVLNGALSFVVREGGGGDLDAVVGDRRAHDLCGAHPTQPGEARAAVSDVSFA